MVEHIGLYPTLAALCGLDAPDYLHGRSFARLMRDPDDDTFAETAAYTISRNKGESLRTAHWRYNLWNDGKAGVELYDQGGPCAGDCTDGGVHVHPTSS